MKMSKKVKSLQQAKKDLVQVVQQQAATSNEFLSFFTSEVVMDVDMSNYGDPTEEPRVPLQSVPNVRVANVAVLKSAWRAADEKKGLMMQEMQREMQNIIVRHQAEVEELKSQQQEQLELASVFETPNVMQNVAVPSPTSTAESEKLRAQVSDLLGKVKMLEGAASSSEAAVASLRASLAAAESAATEASAEADRAKSDLASAAREVQVAKAATDSATEELTALRKTHEELASKSKVESGAASGTIVDLQAQVQTLSLKAQQLAGENSTLSSACSDAKVS